MMMKDWNFCVEFVVTTLVAAVQCFLGEGPWGRDCCRSGNVTGAMLCWSMGDTRIKFRILEKNEIAVTLQEMGGGPSTTPVAGRTGMGERQSVPASEVALPCVAAGVEWKLGNPERLHHGLDMVCGWSDGCTRYDHVAVRPATPPPI